MNDIRGEAGRKGVSGAVFDRIMAGVQPDAKVIEALQAQPEFKTPIWDYLAVLVDEQKVSEGRAMMARHASALASAEQRYGVDRFTIAAVWGVESDYGKLTGRWFLPQALSTLACTAPRRRDYFRGELLAALQIVQRGDLLAGECAGAGVQAGLAGEGVPGEASANFLMGYIRFAHFASGYVLTVGLLGRVYWAVVGNHHARELFWVPIFQRAYCAQRTPRDVILKPRQVKITSVELARDVWFWLTKPGVAVRVICQSSTDHSMLNELSERVGVILAALRKNAGLVLTFASETRTAWVLPNGASLKIVEAGASQAAAEKKERGATLHRVHTTELAVWEYAGATLGGMLESVAAPEAGTEIVHESTPNGMGAEERGDLASADGSAYFYWLCADAKAGRGAWRT